jgi:MSHA biogenesis protein MshK
MAERLSPTLAFLLAFAGIADSAAQAVADPTRPPATAAAEPAEGTPGAAPRPAHRLQSVLISATRKLAVIDGQTVPLGGEIGGATLSAISETGVVLTRGGETETLKLNPAAEKKVERAEKKKGGPQ